MTVSADFIAEHTEAATIRGSQIEQVRALACRHCGVLIWDVPLHMWAAHDIRET